MPFAVYKNTYSKKKTRILSEVDALFKNKRYNAHALWDTGADRTHISENIIEALELIPIGSVPTIAHRTKGIANIYRVDLYLPTKHYVKDIEVLSGEYDELGVDVVIGMDIIQCGDFHIDYTGERAVFTFRHPSEEETYIETELF